MFTIAYDNLLFMLLVFVRMGAMFFTNPVFARRQIPVSIRISFVFILSLLIYPTLDTSAVQIVPELIFIFTIFKELFIGIFFSFLFAIFYFAIFFVGDFLDIQFGLSMAKSVDPTTNIQASISSQLFSIIFILYLFITDAYLAIIKIFASSYDLIPIGAQNININATKFLINTFTAVFSLSLRLMLPFLAAILILEVVLGILMKLVPQLHIMVVNMQIKITMALFLLITLAAPVSAFIDNYILVLLSTVQNGLVALAR